MITAALALLASLGIPLALGGTAGGIFAWFATPGGKAASMLAKEIVKVSSRPLTPEVASRLRRYNEAMKIPLTHQQFNDYVNGKI